MLRKVLFCVFFIILAAGYSRVGEVVFRGARSVPKMLNYQGYLTDTLGSPIDDSLDMTFKIFDAATVGNELWSESQLNVPVERGVFSVLLGSGTPIPDTVFTTGADRWLELTLEGPQTLSPRTRITAMGYAYTATYSDTAEYAKAGPVVADDDWLRGGPSDTVLFTGNYLGIARGGANNVLHGDSVHTHTNLGVACTTGISGQNRQYCTVGGGQINKASGNDATVAGGQKNTASRGYATVGGGFDNIASNTCATVAGGSGNTASGYGGIVAGGWYNKARGQYSVVCGGGGDTQADSNSAIGNYSTIGGGRQNIARDEHATIGGGRDNSTDGTYTTVGGGYSNTADANFAVVGGGNSNIASGSLATVGGGYTNAANKYAATVAGGYYNVASLDYTTVAGGRENTASAYYATVSGGHNNTASDTGATVAGGCYNKARGQYSVVSGGGGPNQADSNSAIGDYSIVSGGSSNIASGDAAAVAGGRYNKARGQYSVVSGGGGPNQADSNSASGEWSTISGGKNNSASGNYAIVGGGYDNVATGYAATVFGGYENVASGQYATVAGGYGDTCLADHGFTANSYSKVRAAHSNAAAFNSQTTTGGSQLRCDELVNNASACAIDHPLDPNGKILNHYTVASTEVLLTYRGVAYISETGETEVRLPDFFDVCNKNPMVQLTGVGTSDVFVAEDVSGNRFVIGGKPGTKVYWMVTGERKDQSAEIAKVLIPVEQPKTGDFFGHSIDDDYLFSALDQLQQMGEVSRFSFRTARGKERYENAKRRLMESK